MKKPIIEALKAYFEQCPLLESLAKVNVDFLDKGDGSYSIEETPATPVVKRFVDGSKECQYLFLFASRRFYATEPHKQNMDNLHLFERITDWIEDNNRNSVFPNLGDERHVESLSVTTGGYLMATSENQQLARYQIQCKLTYKEK